MCWRALEFEILINYSQLKSCEGFSDKTIKSFQFAVFSPHLKINLCRNHSFYSFFSGKFKWKSFQFENVSISNLSEGIELINWKIKCGTLKCFKLWHRMAQNQIQFLPKAFCKFIVLVFIENITNDKVHKWNWTKIQLVLHSTC